MKQSRVFLVIFSLVAVLALTLSACTPADTGPVTFTVSGLVNNELSLTDTGLHKMNVVDISAEHPKNGMQDYSGIRLNELLDEADIQDGATTLSLTASDGYTFEIDLATVRDCADCLVAFGDTAGDYMSVMPGQASKGWVKGLVGIEVK
jgi:DMSO/TMAO reductase YedYZ molybdopterin-dependent catalytic subunit